MLHGIVTGDWHLGSLRRFFPKDHIQRQFAELDKIYTHAVDKGIKHVFVAGDISDTPNMDQSVYVALLLFLMKYDRAITTWYICGNHDFNDISKTSMDLLALLCEKGKMFKNLTVAREAQQVEIEGLTVNLLPYPCLKAPDSGVPSLNISHVEYVGALGDNGRPLRSGEVFEQQDCDYNLTGHLHQHQVLDSRNALYPGAPYQKTFGEKLPKGFVEFKAKVKNGKMKVSHRFVDNKPEFKLVKKTIKTSDDFSDLVADRNIIYSLHLGEGVTLPADLRYKFPNIFNIHDRHSKQKLRAIAKARKTGEPVKSPDAISPTTGLSAALKEKGYDKASIKLAKNLVSAMCDEIGI